MQTRFGSTLLLGLALLFGGCAGMSADECASTDWYAVGFEDGVRGYTADAISNRRRACAKHGITADFQAYQDGRGEGIKEFCQPQRGFNLGAGGGRYQGVCPAHLEGGFLDAYRTGSQLHTLRTNVNSATYAINAREAELANLHDSISAAEAGIIAAETTVQDRILMVADLKEMNEQIGHLEAEIDDLIAERARHEQELANYEQILADSGY